MRAKLTTAAIQGNTSRVVLVARRGNQVSNTIRGCETTDAQRNERATVRERRYTDGVKQTTVVLQ